MLWSMGPDWVTQFVAPLVVALVTALVTTAGVAAREWLDDRDRDSRARRQLELAANRVEFITSWISLQERLGGIDEAAATAARIDLLDAYEQARQGWTAASEKPPRLSLRRVLSQILLITSARNRRARVAQVFYWLSLAWFAFWLGVSAAVMGEPGHSVGYLIATTVTSTIFGLAPIVATRAVFRYFNERQ
jgi:hypothetical protein